MVAPLLVTFLHHPHHRFWPDAVSLLHHSCAHADRLLEAGPLTDAYLLALAVQDGGHLVTLDQRLCCEAVIGGREALWLIDL